MRFTALKDVCGINMGQSPDSSSYNDEGRGIPFFQGNADFGERHPSVRVWCDSPTKIAKANDILISVRAPIGALNYAQAECCIGRGLAAITPDSSKVSPGYIYWLLKSKSAELNSKGTGSTFKAINRKVLEEVLVPDIDITQQTACANKLETVYRITQYRRQQLQKLDDLIKARFVEMFGDCKTNPKGWDTVALGEISEVGSSKRVFVDELKESGIPFYRGTEIGALAEGKTIVPELFIAPHHYKELIAATGKPAIGDLLMPSICPDGRIWVVDSDEPFYFKDGRVLWVHSISDRFNPIFLLHTLKDRIMTDYSSIASGTTFAELKIFALKNCRVFMVPMEKQLSFVTFIKRLNNSQSIIRHSLGKTQLLFDSLMQQYFN